MAQSQLGGSPAVYHKPALSTSHSAPCWPPGPHPPVPVPAPRTWAECPFCTVTSPGIAAQDNRVRRGLGRPTTGTVMLSHLDPYLAEKLFFPKSLATAPCNFNFACTCMWTAHVCEKTEECKQEHSGGETTPRTRRGVQGNGAKETSKRLMYRFGSVGWVRWSLWPAGRKSPQVRGQGRRQGQRKSGGWSPATLVVSYDERSESWTLWACEASTSIWNRKEKSRKIYVFP